MMTIEEVYERFEQLHSYAFSTIDGEYPEIRIAHFLTYDAQGLYFQTMKVKPFYAQLRDTKKVAVCALVAEDGAAKQDEQGLSEFPPGFFIRVSGDVRELSPAELRDKCDADPSFLPLAKDIERYPAMTTFLLYRFKGELYDYDYACENRDHKLERQRFSFGSMEYVRSGFSIDPGTCIACGNCATVCTFGAIVPGPSYGIDPHRCDECGSCYTVCPVSAIAAKVPMAESLRKECGKKTMAFHRPAGKEVPR
jgi:ferredoxin